MGAIEPPVTSCLLGAGELADQVEPSESRGHAQVPRLEAEQAGNLSMTPEQRGDQRRAAVPTGAQVGASTGREQEVSELRLVRVARLVQLRPAVVVAPVRVGPAIEQQPHELEPARHSEQVVAVRTALPHELGVAVEQLGQPLAIARLERPVGEHERALRLLAAPDRREVPAQRGEAPESMPGGELGASLLERSARGRRDAGARSS